MSPSETPRERIKMVLLVYPSSFAKGGDSLQSA
jgi:hypothetical protein